MVLAYLENPSNCLLVRSIFSELIAETRNYPYTKPLGHNISGLSDLLSFIASTENYRLRSAAIKAVWNGLMLSYLILLKNGFRKNGHFKKLPIQEEI